MLAIYLDLVNRSCVVLYIAVNKD